MENSDKNPVADMEQVALQVMRQKKQCQLVVDGIQQTTLRMVIHFIKKYTSYDRTRKTYHFVNPKRGSYVFKLMLYKPQLESLTRLLEQIA